MLSSLNLKHSWHTFANGVAAWFLLFPQIVTLPSDLPAPLVTVSGASPRCFQTHCSVDDPLLAPSPLPHPSPSHSECTVNLGSHPVKETAPKRTGKDVGESASRHHHQWGRVPESPCEAAQFCILCTCQGCVGLLCPYTDYTVFCRVSCLGVWT